MSTRKQPGENPLLDFDMSTVLKRAGDNIVTVKSVTCTAVSEGVGNISDLTITNISFSGKLVQANVAGGVSDETYKITVIIDTATSFDIEGDFYLPVVEE